MYFNYLYFNYFTTLLLKSRVSFIGVIYTVGISDGLAIKCRGGLRCCPEQTFVMSSDDFLLAIVRFCDIFVTL